VQFQPNGWKETKIERLPASEEHPNTKTPNTKQNRRFPRDYILLSWIKHSALRRHFTSFWVDRFPCRFFTLILITQIKPRKFSLILIKTHLNSRVNQVKMTPKHTYHKTKFFQPFFNSLKTPCLLLQWGKLGVSAVCIEKEEERERGQGWNGHMNFGQSFSTGSCGRHLCFNRPTHPPLNCSSSSLLYFAVLKLNF